MWAAIRQQYVRQLTDAAVDDIETAMRDAMSKGLKPHEISKDHFPLRTTAGLLGTAYKDIENGRGFVVLAGWPVDRFSYEENVVAYCGVILQRRPQGLERARLVPGIGELGAQGPAVLEAGVAENQNCADFS